MRIIIYIELKDQLIKKLEEKVLWSGWRDSNPRRLAWEEPRRKGGSPLPPFYTNYSMPAKGFQAFFQALNRIKYDNLNHRPSR